MPYMYRPQKMLRYFYAEGVNTETDFVMITLRGAGALLVHEVDGMWRASAQHLPARLSEVSTDWVLPHGATVGSQTELRSPTHMFVTPMVTDIRAVKVVTASADFTPPPIAGDLRPIKRVI